MVDDHAVHTNVIVDLCPAVDSGIDQRPIEQSAARRI
jgi:hypothetical protein